ncbi:hypothetical protein [Winogradskya humida]|uniref:Type III secretion system (T3SS) SseB-like protein n=1 Tax=Winogradskya humida TaxID=113566 RepID=A0ABQ3ZFA3_9ACTN|nr:hypothetical protein [Actinoplanes humidus]GIE17202.1 hypothetical protein Ahu01nite_003040 [Actinoplanes humidus]
MSDTPLSDVMAEYADTKDPQTFARFVELFAASTIGIVTHGERLGAGMTTYGDGKSRILSFADSDARSRWAAGRYNAGVQGAMLLRMAADNPCEGILVNCATREISLVIDRDTARAALNPPPKKTPWWKRGKVG